MSNKPDSDSLVRASQLMLASLAYAEHFDTIYHPEDIDMWAELREEISRRTHEFLQALSPLLIDADAEVIQ